MASRIPQNFLLVHAPNTMYMCTRCEYNDYCISIYLLHKYNVLMFNFHFFRSCSRILLWHALLPNLLRGLQKGRPLRGRNVSIAILLFYNIDPLSGSKIVFKAEGFITRPTINSIVVA